MRREIHGGNIYKYDHRVYDFSANLNPLGMPQEARAAIVKNIDNYETYPDTANRKLAKTIAKKFGINAGSLCFGNGAADIIFRIPLALRPRKALIVAPTFSEYEEALRTVDCKIINYILNEEETFHLDRRILSELDADDYNILFLCNPNNPTGIPVRRDLILEIAEKCRENSTVLVVDECFMDFLFDQDEYSILKDIEGLENVIIIRAFTKIFAMAGLRLGYCICGNLEYADIINCTLQPWSVSTVAGEAGIGALSAEGYVEKTKQFVSNERTKLQKAIIEAGFTTYDSKANYIFFRGPIDLKERMEEKNIIIRDCSNYSSLEKGYYRIAVRTEMENDYFINILKGL